MSIKDGTLFIQDEQEERKISLRELDFVLFAHKKNNLTSEMFYVFETHRIRWLFVSKSHADLSHLQNKTLGTIARRQLIGSLGKKRFYLCKKIIQTKLLHQRRLLAYYYKYSNRTASTKLFLHETLQTMDAILYKIKGFNPSTEPDIQRLLLYEAQGAKSYWRAFQKLLINVSFLKRQKRHAKDPVNILLNTGYKILLKNMIPIVESIGLNIQLGFLHTKKKNAPALILDLMEIYRQTIVDRHVFSFFLKKKKKVLSLSEMDFSTNLFQIQKSLDEIIPSMKMDCEALLEFLSSEQKEWNICTQLFGK